MLQALPHLWQMWPMLQWHLPHLLRSLCNTCAAGQLAPCPASHSSQL